jgi:hypothetical protein
MPGKSPEYAKQSRIEGEKESWIDWSSPATPLDLFGEQRGSGRAVYRRVQRLPGATGGKEVKKMDLQKKLDSYIQAAFPILSVNTVEEIRSLAIIKSVAEQRGRPCYVYSITRGVVEITDSVDGAERNRLSQIKDQLEFISFIRGVEELEEYEKNKWRGGGIFVFLDPDKYLEEDHFFVRSLKDEIVEFRKGKTLILMGAALKIPVDLQPFVTNIDVPLPGRNELAQTVKDINGEGVEDELLHSVVSALMGLTTDEAGDVVALSLVDRGILDPNLIMSQKCEQLSNLDFLNVINRDKLPKPEEVGGLENLKEFLMHRKTHFSREAKDFKLPSPKGVMLIGPPGTGKSLTVKASGGTMELPVVLFRISALFDQYVGNTERNTRLAIKIAEAMAPCIMWIDELDKQFAGSGGGADNSHEVTKRVIGELLSWMQEKTEPVFIMATANNVQSLAQQFPELFRSGRFDEIFYIDLPSRKEREAIWAIQIEKYGRSPEIVDVGELARNTENWTGAEIEGAVRKGLTLAFAEGIELEQKHIEVAITKTVPTFELSREKITALRDWASGRAVNASVVEKETSTKRRIQK